jgi:hypothetical protein
VVARLEVLLQLAEQPPGVRVARAVRVGRLPQQAHQQVAAPVGPEGGLGQLDRELTAHGDVLGSEQAVMGDPHRLGQQLGIPGCPDLPERGHDVGVRAARVVRLAGQPGPDPQRQRRGRVEQREHVLEPGLEQHRAGDGAPLADPQAGQAQRRQRHRLRVLSLLGQPVGALEALPARLQVTVLVLRPGALREQGAEVARTDEFQAAGGHRPVGLSRHKANLLAAARQRREMSRRPRQLRPADPSRIAYYAPGGFANVPVAQMNGEAPWPG